MHQKNDLLAIGRWLETSLSEMDIPKNILSLVDLELVTQYDLIPYEETDELLTFATSKIEAAKLTATLKSRYNKNIKVMFTDENNINEAKIKYYGILDQSGTFILGDDLIENEEENQSEAFEYESPDIIGDATSPLAKRINNIFTMALQRRTSDIHFHPTDKGFDILFRIDGRLILMNDKVHKSIIERRNRDTNHVVNRIKMMCSPNLDTNSITTQGGRIQFPYQNRIVDCRVSVIPSIREEGVVIRLLDEAKTARDINKLGFDDTDIIRLKKALAQPSGLMIVTGPTNSGKSTTLYSAIGLFDPRKWSIITVEDPVEYKDERLLQVQVRRADLEKVDMTFAKYLREMLRHDPDIILIGEIRDSETADIAINSSLTGHKVFSTLHNKNVITTIARLCNMGVDRLTLLGELSCVVSQRLVGLICPECVEEYYPNEEELIQLSETEKEKIKGKTLRRGKGGNCPRCNGTGYNGLTAVGEFLFLDNDIRDFLMDTRSTKQIMSYLSEKGFVTMWDKAFNMVLEGKISLEDIIEKVPRNE